MIHLEVIFVIEVGENTADGREDVRSNSCSYPTRTRMRLTEASVRFAAVRRNVRGAMSDAVGYSRVVGFGGERPDAHAFGMGDSFRATFAEIENLVEITIQ